MRSKTIPYDFPEVVGYMLNTKFSAENITKIQAIQGRFSQQFGDAVWVAPAKALHITLFDWIAPLVDYDGQDKDGLYQKNKTIYDRTLRMAIQGVGPIEVSFNEIVVFPAAIIIRGTDGGQYDRIRRACRGAIELLPGTKSAPNIIHSTIARFNQPIELDAAQQFSQSLNCGIRHTTNQFRLVYETKDPMLEFAEIKIYELG